jgi:hypothetical protein
MRQHLAARDQIDELWTEPGGPVERPPTLATSTGPPDTGSMIMAPTIDDWYRGALEKLREEVHRTPDADALGRDTDEWTQYLVRRWGMVPIEVDLGAIQLEETTRDGYPAVLVVVPAASTDETFNLIAKHGLAGGVQWLGFDYRTFFSDRYPGHIGQVVSQTKGEVEQARRRIEQYVQSLNASIEHANKTFPRQVARLVVLLGFRSLTSDIPRQATRRSGTKRRRRTRALIWAALAASVFCAILADPSNGIESVAEVVHMVDLEALL